MKPIKRLDTRKAKRITDQVLRWPPKPKPEPKRSGWLAMGNGAFKRYCPPSQ